MMTTRYGIGVGGTLVHRDGQYMKEVVMGEIANPHSETGKSEVTVLCVDEAMALIAREYGFEYNSIRIRDICWYAATDWNYFRFSVAGWEYEVRDFGALEVV